MLNISALAAINHDSEIRDSYKKKEQNARRKQC